MKKTKLGQELISSLNDAIDYEHGKRNLRTSLLEIPAPAKNWRKEEIVRIRKELFHVSQPVFASLLSVTTSTVRAWEQGLKKPSGAASRLLELAVLEPRIFEKLVRKQQSA